MSVIKPSQLSAAIKKKIDDANKQATKTWATKGSTLVNLLINADLDEGKSPVAKQKFEDYKKSTQRKKGRKRPVDLYETGKMRRSLKTSATASNNISVKFTSPVAKYHNDGTPNMARRAIVPKEGESFNQKITRALSALFKKLYKI